MKTLHRLRPDHLIATPEPLEVRISPATILVTTTADAGPGSLRQAILDANSAAFPGPDLISFASGSLPSTGPLIVSLETPLPVITETVTIDGYTAAGTAPNTAAVGTNAILRVMLDGAMSGGNGLVFFEDADSDANGSVVRGLVISGFNPAINENGFGIFIKADNVTVAGNFIGTNIAGDQLFSGVNGAGTTITGNRNAGVGIGLFGGADTYSGNIIGGTDRADRNILAGGAFGVFLSSSADGNSVFGNLIGTDRTGFVALPNLNSGVAVAGSANLIGGEAPGMGNVISGNSGRGIDFGSGSGLIIQGNLIGVTADGLSPLPNEGPGIRLQNAGSNVVIGGGSAAAANVISANLGPGIQIGSDVGDGPADSVTVRGNFIGTDKSGVRALGNQNGGINVTGSVGSFIGGTNPGDANVISFNQGSGVRVSEDFGSPARVLILGNGIRNNSGLGIDLVGGTSGFTGVTLNDNRDVDSGPNDLTNWPVLEFVNNSGADFSLDVEVTAFPSTPYRIEFFAVAPDQVDLSGHGEGTVFLGALDILTNGSGLASANFTGTMALPPNTRFTATISNLIDGVTSEFSRAVGPADTYTWTGAVSSDWFDPQNWSSPGGPGVPGALDAAIYSGAGNPIRLDVSAAVSSFQHSAGSMLGVGQLFVRDSLSWTGGSHDGTGLVLDIGAIGLIDGGGTNALGWNKGSFEIFGDLTLNGGGLSFNDGILHVGATGSLTLNAGIVDQDGIGTLSLVTNDGRITKLGTGAFGITTTSIDSSGITEARVGTLILGNYTGFGASQLLLNGGNVQALATLTLDTDAELRGSGNIIGDVNNAGGYIFPGGDGSIGELFISGTYAMGELGALVMDIQGTQQGIGYDHLRVQGTALLDGGLLVSILPGFAPVLGNVFGIVSGGPRTGTFDYVVGAGALTENYTATNAQLVRAGQTFVWDAGGGADTSWSNPQNWAPTGVPGSGDAAILNTSAVITLNGSEVEVGDFLQSAGTLSGDGQLRVLGSFQWSGGVQSGAGTTLTDFGSSLVLEGGSKTLDGRTLYINGNGASAPGAPLTLANDALVFVGGLLDLQNATPFQVAGGGGRLEVGAESILQKSTTGDITFGSALTVLVDGTLDVQAGSLLMTNAGGADRGIFRVGPGAVLQFNSPSGFTLGAETVFEGGGVVQVVGGLLGLGSGSPIKVDEATTFELAAGALTAASGNLLLDGNFRWSGGGFVGGGGLTVSGAFDIVSATAKSLSQWQILAAGSGQWSGTGDITLDLGANIDISGAILISDDLALLQTGIGGGFEVLPAGALEVDGAAVAFAMPVQSAGSIRATNNSSVTFENGLQQFAGSLFIEAGATASTPALLSIGAGIVSGEGTISGSLENTGGVVAPGTGAGDAGTLTITANYTQGSSGRLIIEARSLTAGSGYDQLLVGGSASLDGIVDFIPVGSFSVPTPSTFNIIAGASTRSGVFTIENVPPGGSVSYSSSGAAVVFTGAPTPIFVTNLDDAGPGSLRQAILQANATPGTDVINFNIPGAGVRTISPLSALPAITDAVMIDGYSQPGATVNTNSLPQGSNAVILIEINGELSDADTGLLLTSGGSTIRGLSIYGYVPQGGAGDLSGGAIRVLGGAGGNRFTGNFLGLAADGTLKGNFRGVLIEGSEGDVIGGSIAAERNIVSGNTRTGIEIGTGAHTATIRSNIIGAGPDGISDRGNPGAGILISGADDVLIGGTDGTGNVIVANDDGILLRDSDGSSIFGNRIGMDIMGNSLGNSGDGINPINDVTNLAIGGIGFGQGNIIAFNNVGISSLPDAGGFSTGFTIRGNSIFGNTLLGINLVGGTEDAAGVTDNDGTDADPGPNNLQNYPVLTSATRSFSAGSNVSGSLNSTPGTSFFIDFYANFEVDPSGFGEGQVFLGDIAVTTNTSGLATFNFNPGALRPLTPGTFITAIATNQATGDSSEFSAALPVVSVFKWDGGAGNSDWSNPLNWDLDTGSPGALDAAILDIDDTVDLGSISRSVGSYEQTAGTLTGSGDLTVTENFVWANGNMSGAGATNAAVGSLVSLAGDGTKTLDQRTLKLAGTSVWTGDGSITLANGAAINNSGNFEIRTDAALTGAGTFTNLAGGTFGKNVASGLTTIGINFTNAGDFNATVGTVRFDGSFVQTAGNTRLESTGAIQTSTLLQFQGGDLRGNRTITGDVSNSGATVRPGDGLLGTLTIDGNYTQSGTGSLLIQLGGTNPGQFDVLRVTGNATLGGSLNITSFAGFTPAGGDTFRVVESANNPGTFGTLSGASAGLSQIPDTLGLVLSAAGITYTWDNSVGNGDWFNPLNWDRDSGVPAAADTAILNINSTINLSAPTSVGAFNQSAGALLGEVLNLVSGGAWTGGNIGGALLVEDGATFEVSGAGGKSLNGGGGITIEGIMTLAGGDISVNSTGITILSGGLLDLQGDASIVHVGGGGSGIINQGTLRKSGGTGTSSITVTDFTHRGIVDAQSGTLRFDNSGFGGVAFSGFAGSTVQAALGASVVFPGGATFTSSAFSGAGSKTYSGTNLSLNGNIAAGGFTIASGGWSGTSTITGALNWTGGDHQGVTTIGSGGTLNIDGAGTKFISGAGGSRGIVNQGAIILNGSGDLRIENGGYVDVHTGALFDLQGDTGIVQAGGGVSSITNAGTVRKSGGIGATSMTIGAFINTGVVEVQFGTLAIASSVTTGTLGGPNGVFDAAAGTAIDFTGSATFTNTSFTGTGAHTYSGTSVTLEGNIAAGGLTLASGGWSGTSTITGSLNWTGGDHQGVTTIASGGTLNITGAGPKFISGAGGSRGIVNQGTITFGGTGDLRIENGGYVDNQVAAIFKLQGNAAITQLGGGISTFNNAGTLLRETGSGTASLTVGNVVNSGGIRIETGTLEFGGLTQSSGFTELAGGSLSGTGTLNFNGGELRGAGMISASISNSAAVVRPGGGGATGSLQITGSYVQGAAGVLEIEIQGTGNGQFDRLEVTGNASLDGTLTSLAIAGFTITPPASFPVMSYGSRAGGFGTENLPPDLQTEYQATALLLTTPTVSGPLVVNSVLDIVDPVDSFTTLREAIIFANLNPGIDTITFNIPGTGVHTIAPDSPLPAITDPLIINGYSQPGSAANELSVGNDAILRVELNGANAGSAVSGLVFDAGSEGSTVRGLAINEFSGMGIVLQNGGGNTVAGNFIGVDATGTIDRGMGGSGIFISSPGNQIGGTTAADRNVISGNAGSGVAISTAAATSNVIRGNYVGTDASGVLAIGNFVAGIFIETSSNNTIGGDSVAARNLISGNVGAGIFVTNDGNGTTNGNIISGNYVGTAADGATALGNGESGIRIENASTNTTVGGVTPGKGNLIAFNGGNGVAVVDAGTVGNLILGNTIRDNTLLGIDLGGDGITGNDPFDGDGGPNGFINFPELASAAVSGSVTNVSGTVTVAASATVRVEFFLASSGLFLGAIDVGAVAGAPVAFNATLSGVMSGDLILATSSLAGEGTSEFSAAVTAVPPALVSISDAAIVEGHSGTKQLIFTLTLDQAVPATVTVTYDTAPFSADARSATAGVDYVGVTGGLATFAPNQLSQTIAITLNGDTALEPVERFHVVLRDASNAGIGSDTGVGTILDDDRHTIAIAEGNGNRVSVYITSSSGATLLQTFEAFAPNFKGGVRVAVGDVNGDGVDDVVAGAGLGGRAKVRVFDGANGFAPMDGVLGEFSAFGRTYRGGVFVATGDVDGDGTEDVIVTPSAGSSNRVNIFSGADGTLINSFRAFAKGTGGVRVAAGDVNGDGLAEIIVGTGVGSSVRIFDAVTGSVPDVEGSQFRAFGKNFRGGVFVAAGDLNADGRADLIVSSGAGAPQVRSYLQGISGAIPKTFEAYTGAKFGTRIGVLDINGDGIADIIASKGRRGDNLIRAVDGLTTGTMFTITAHSKQRDGLYVG